MDGNGLLRRITITAGPIPPAQRKCLSMKKRLHSTISGQKVDSHTFTVEVLPNPAGQPEHPPLR